MARLSALYGQDHEVRRRRFGYADDICTQEAGRRVAYLREIRISGLSRS